MMRILLLSILSLFFMLWLPLVGSAQPAEDQRLYQPDIFAGTHNFIEHHIVDKFKKNKRLLVGIVWQSGSSKGTNVDNLQGDTPEVQRSSGNGVLYLILILTMTGLFLTFYAFKKVKTALHQLNRKMKRLEEKLSGKQSGKAWQPVESNPGFEQQLRETAGKLEQKMDELDHQMQKINQKLEEQSNAHHEEETGNETLPEESGDKGEKVEKFYGMPVGNLFTGEESNPERVMYKITMDENKNEGTFTFFFHKEMVKNIAMNQPDKFIKQACTIINPGANNPTDIKMDEPGRVIKKNDGWEIKQKARIRMI